MDKTKLKSLVECLLFVTNRPLSLAELADVTSADKDSVSGILSELKTEMAERQSALQIMEVAEGYQMAAQEGYGYWVKKLFKDMTTFRLSPSALETLSIIAYKQPITRAEIEEIRGVEVSGVLETLVERKIVRIVGRKEVVGRPLLYGTTPQFLRHFNLWKISELPSLETIAESLQKSAGAAEEAAAAAAAPAEVSSDEVEGDIEIESDPTEDLSPAVASQIPEPVAPEAQAEHADSTLVTEPEAIEKALHSKDPAAPNENPSAE